MYRRPAGSSRSSLDTTAIRIIGSALDRTAQTLDFVLGVEVVH